MTMEVKSNDVSHSQSLVCTSSSLSLSHMDEPEMSSISFQDSLRFFQEQLIINSSSAKVSEAHVRCRMGSSHAKQQHYCSSESLTLTEDSSDNSSSCSSTSSKITPIPTVETILESVRILRAIQKSQAQRNPLWALEEKDDELRMPNCQDELPLQSNQDLSDSIERPEIDLLANIDDGCSRHVVRTATEQRSPEVQIENPSDAETSHVTKQSKHEHSVISSSEEMFVDSAVGSECTSPTRSGSSKSDDNELCSLDTETTNATVFQEDVPFKDVPVEEEQVLDVSSRGCDTHNSRNETCRFCPMNAIDTESTETKSSEGDHRLSSEGDHRLSSEGDHRLSSEGDHRLSSEGDHRLSSEGDHRLSSEGDHRLSSEGDHRLSSEGDNRWSSEEEHRLSSEGDHRWSSELKEKDFYSASEGNSDGRESAESPENDCENYSLAEQCKNNDLIDLTSATVGRYFSDSQNIASVKSCTEVSTQIPNQTKTDELAEGDGDLRASPDLAQNCRDEVSEQCPDSLLQRPRVFNINDSSREEKDPNAHSFDDLLGNVSNSSSSLEEWRKDCDDHESSESESHCDAATSEISAEEESHDRRSFFEEYSGSDSLMKSTATNSSAALSENDHAHLFVESSEESGNILATVDSPERGCEGHDLSELPDINCSALMDATQGAPNAQETLDVSRTISISHLHPASAEPLEKDTSYHEPIKLLANESSPPQSEEPFRLILAQKSPNEGQTATDSDFDPSPRRDSNEQKVTEFILQHDYSSGDPPPLSWCEEKQGGSSKCDREGRDERSQSALDSGIGMDKSLDRSSPISDASSPNCEESEKELWSDATSTTYDSAEDSPFVSLTDVTEVSSLSEDTEREKEITEGNSGSSINSSSSEKNEQSIYSVSNQHSNDIYGSNIDDTDVDFDNCSSSLGDMDSASLPELSEDRDTILSSTSHHIEREDSPKPSDDIQNDRLLEIIEDSIHQVELQQPTQTENLVSKAHFIISKPEMTHCSDDSVIQEVQLIESNEYKIEDEIVKINDTITEVDHAVNEQTDQVISHETEIVARDIECITSKLQNKDDLKDSNINMYFQCPDSEVVNVDKINCTEQVLLNEVDDSNKETESSRPKKNLTSSWNPTALLEHLYRIEKYAVQKDSNIQNDCLDGYINILPLGTFSRKYGQLYISVKNGSFSCYEAKESEKLVFTFSLRNGVIESNSDKLIIDNRCGRCVHMKFASEHELILWQTALKLHCMPLSSKYLEPVHYPLKCHKDVIIVDLGSCSTRAGILMDQPTLPTVFFPTVCATDKITGNQVYGMEALLPEVRQSSVLSFPVRPSSKVTKFTMDISALEGLFKEVFHKLNVDPKAYTVQVCIPRSLSIHTQVALVKMLLEDLDVKAVSLTRQALLTLYAHNTATAIVVDIGDRMDILPVVDGFIVENGVTRLPYGGQRIIHHMKHALAQKHISLSNEVESFVVQYVMENLCYIAEDYENEMQYAASVPEGIKKSIPLYPFCQGDNILQTVTLDSGRFQVPEGLFNPDLWGADFPGIHKLIHHAIQVSGVDVRRRIAENIIVSGGVTLLPGFVERLQAEVGKLTLPRIRPQIHASPYRYHMAYLGACQLSASDAFSQVCVTIDDWNQEGSSCLRKWHL